MFSINRIIDIQTTILSSAFGATNFGVPCFFYDTKTEGDNTVGFESFSDATAVATKHPDLPLLIAQTQAWFGSGGGAIETYGFDSAALPGEEYDAITFLEALTEAASRGWFYTPFYSDAAVLLAADDIVAAATWCNANERFLGWTETNISDATNSGFSDDIGSKLKASGQRRSFAGVSNTDYLHIKAFARLSKIDYSAVNSYTDLEYKSVSHGGDEFTAIDNLIEKGYLMHVPIASKGSETSPMFKNTLSYSNDNETVSEVIASDAFVSGLQAALANKISSQKNMPQTRAGQQLLISSAEEFTESFITNGFLGEREVDHPVTGEKTLTRGYIMISIPEDIDKISAAARANHEMAPITLYIYGSGSGWSLKVSLTMIK